ncbi:MAG: adenylyl-sulfate kinase [Chitinophagaceae bacterium]|nr:adenylyl-sulfate kinase [Chitinophagaceae bacterium]
MWHRCSKVRGNVGDCITTSPYADIRNEIRGMCKKFVEVHVSTDIKVCIERDPKGLYAKAIAGEIKDFTGISLPLLAPKIRRYYSIQQLLKHCKLYR